MSLFKSLASALSLEPQHETQGLNPEMAAAVLLVAMERADFESSPEERAKIEHLLARHFELAEGEIEALLVAAEKETGESVSFYDYVKSLNEHMNHTEKCELLRMLWEVAYADGHLDPFEEQLMRRLADMLYLPHSDYVRLKLHVTEANQSV